MPELSPPASLKMSASSCHGICRATVFLTGILIAAGALVTTTGSGLAVPDWPTTFGTFFPPFVRWVNGVQFEHTHRLIAGLVGLLTIACAIRVVRRETRLGVRFLAVAAAGTVLVQAVLGGMTVLLKLPTAVSASHAIIAQTFFCLIVSLSVKTSSTWTTASRCPASTTARRLQVLTILTTAAVWLELTVGATMRHLHAGLAIPDFPLSYGHLVPPVFSPIIAVNFGHRVGGLAIVLLTAFVVGIVLIQLRSQPQLVAAALRLGALVCLQIALGATTVWTRRDVVVTTLHVLNGALVLVSSVVLALWAFRVFEPRGLPPASHPSDAAVSQAPTLDGAVA